MEFNLLEDLYLDLRNRDILSIVLRYTTRGSRQMIMESFKFVKHMCKNCFKSFSDLNSVLCNQAYISWEKIFLFCENCKKEHYKLYTSRYYLKCSKIYRPRYGEYILQVKHDCEFGHGYFIHKIFCLDNFSRFQSECKKKGLKDNEFTFQKYIDFDPRESIISGKYFFE